MKPMILRHLRLPILLGLGIFLGLRSLESAPAKSSIIGVSMDILDFEQPKEGHLQSGFNRPLIVRVVLKSTEDTDVRMAYGDTFLLLQDKTKICDFGLAIARDAKVSLGEASVAKGDPLISVDGEQKNTTLEKGTFIVSLRSFEPAVLVLIFKHSDLTNLKSLNIPGCVPCAFPKST